MKALNVVYVFAEKDGFGSQGDLDEYVFPEYDEDGEEIESPFMKEVGFSEFEPMAIETHYSAMEVTAERLFDGFSYSEQWRSRIEKEQAFRIGLAVYPPNEIKNPTRARLQYLGAFEFDLEE